MIKKISSGRVEVSFTFKHAGEASDIPAWKLHRLLQRLLCKMCLGASLLVKINGFCLKAGKDLKGQGERNMEIGRQKCWIWFLSVYLFDWKKYRSFWMVETSVSFASAEPAWALQVLAVWKFKVWIISIEMQWMAGEDGHFLERKTLWLDLTSLSLITHH